MSSLPACFLKHPCKQCSYPLEISSISLERCCIFSRFNVIISNPAIFLPIFSFTLVTRHSNKMLFWRAATTHAVFFYDWHACLKFMVNFRKIVVIFVGRNTPSNKFLDVVRRETITKSYGTVDEVHLL